MNRILIVPLLFFVSFLNAQFFMFPGDTNNDGVANYIDVLPIGLAYQAEGPAREVISIDWIQQEFFPWGQTLPFSGVEFGFIDCDGNGIIDSLDIEAIAVNYDSTQMDAFPPPMPYNPSDTLFTTDIPGILVSFNIDTAYVQDTFFAEIKIIFPDSIAVEPALGLALGLEYDAGIVKDSLTVIFPDTISDDLMFVTAASNFLSFWRLPNEGRMEIGAAGRGQNSIGSTRTIATARIIVEDLIIRSEGDKPFFFELSDILLLNKQEQVLNINFHSDTLLLLDTIVGIKELVDLSQSIRVYPNPAKEYFLIESNNDPVQELILYNAMGQAILKESIFNLNRIRLPIKQFPFGFYVLQIRTEYGIASKKVVISN